MTSAGRIPLAHTRLQLYAPADGDAAGEEILGRRPAFGFGRALTAGR
jgi:hypothetical protein